MNEYFVFANSFAAPFVSDSLQVFVKGDDPGAALAKYVEDYNHPAKLYFAAIYASADAFHKNEKALETWTCNHELELRKRTKKGNCHSVCCIRPGKIEIDGELVVVESPYLGKFA